MEENKLIKFESGALQKVGNAISITNKLLAITDRKKIIELFLSYPDFFKRSISKNYPLNNVLIEKYQEIWNWSYLSSNKGLYYDEYLIEKYAQKWDWAILSWNEQLPWNNDFIEKYKNKWSWGALSSNSRIQLNADLILKYKDKWDWNYMCVNKSLNWFETLDNYSQNFDFECKSVFSLFLYGAELFPWSEEIILKYYNRINWKKLSESKVLPWSEKLIDKFIDKWDWNLISCNNSIPWNSKLFDKYKESLNWKELSKNHYLPWSEDFIDNNKDKFSWFSLSSNEAIPWTKGLIDKYIQKWDWHQLSQNSSIPWSVEFIEEHKNKFDWTALSKNKSVINLKEAIEVFKDDWDWNQLSSNTGIFWTIYFISKYENKLSLDFFGTENTASSSARDLAKSKNRTFEQIFNSTRDNFLNTPSVYATSPHFKKNREVYFNSMAKHYDINFLQAISQQLEINQNSTYEEFTAINPVYFFKPIHFKTGLNFLGNSEVWKKVFQPYVDDAMIEEVMKKIKN